VNRHERRRSKQERLKDAGFIPQTEAAADDGHDTKHWYFVVGSGELGGAFHVDQLKIAKDDRGWAEEARAALVMELLSRRPIVMHDFDDELRLARFCADVAADEITRLRKRLDASEEKQRVLARRSPSDRAAGGCRDDRLPIPGNTRPL
jgi:hypothetical protein